MTDRLDILDAIRAEEVNGVQGLFPKPARLLELGGSDGFQARILADAGWDVASIDIATRTRHRHAHFEVLDYDGYTIPFPNGSFDAIFSSNVLEHIPHLAHTLAETRRVLKPGGIAVHVLPSPAWRFWTILTHYPHVLAALSSKLHRSSSGSSVASSLAEGIRPTGSKWLRALGLLPHGEYPNALAELYYFSRARWTREFETNGFTVASCTAGNLFYTGHLLATALPVSARKQLAFALGSACHVFLLRSS